MDLNPYWLAGRPGGAHRVHLQALSRKMQLIVIGGLPLAWIVAAAP